MSLREHARHSLTTSRKAFEMVLAEFKTDEDWLHQPCENGNHAIWIVAHLGLADNAFAAKFRPEVDRQPEGWEKLFWYGSEIQSDPSVYPSREEVLEYFQDRRNVLLRVLKEISDEEFDAAAPQVDERSPVAGAPSVGHWFFFAAFHEGIHMGQLTAAHRSMGHQPVMQPQPAEATG